jgi:hypothetical protein
VQWFLEQWTLNVYREQLANERAETERLFILKVLARKEAEDRSRSVRGWNVAEGQGKTNGKS